MRHSRCATLGFPAKSLFSSCVTVVYLRDSVSQFHVTRCVADVVWSSCVVNTIFKINLTYFVQKIVTLCGTALSDSGFPCPVTLCVTVVACSSCLVTLYVTAILVLLLCAASRMWARHRSAFLPSSPTHVLAVLHVRNPLCVSCVTPKFHKFPSRGNIICSTER